MRIYLLRFKLCSTLILLSLYSVLLNVRIFVYSKNSLRRLCLEGLLLNFFKELAVDHAPAGSPGYQPAGSPGLGWQAPQPSHNPQNGK